MANDIDIIVFFVFFEILYIPMVFGLPILGLIILREYYKTKNKSFKIQLCLSLSILICILFCVKMYYWIFEKTLLF
jgi:NADH:ubiquinone oxidoreductase subunit 4 (subunit M)